MATPDPCAGADFAAWLRFAGYDVVIVEGKAEKPVYLHITTAGCTFVDAADLWGMDTLRLRKQSTSGWVTRRG